MRCFNLAFGVSAIATTVLMGCTPPGWSEYRAGMTCHLQNEADCEKYYEEAIEKNPELPGVHSSYGAYLYTRGRRDEAGAQLRKETEVYPQSKKAVGIALNPDIGNSQPAAEDSLTMDKESQVSE